VSFRVQHVSDSFHCLRESADDEYDVTITDPPYNDHVHSNMMSGTTFKQYVDGIRKESGVPKVESKFAALAGYEFALDLIRVSRRWALSFCALEDFGAYRATVGQKRYARSAVWYKPNSMGQLTGDRPAAAYEGIAVMHREGKKRWNGRGSYGIWKCNGTRGEKGRHPNQKPLSLCLMLVAKFSERGETVFDPFCGSGRIGEAALLLGRQYVGWDSDADWVARATERLAAVVPGSMSDEQAITLCSMKEAA
jgi:site-specific DNA-methyltransferase (adenine-specific)